MKIKDVLGEAEVTLKPMPGAQEVDIDGKAVGTATTPAAATAISDLAKKGEFTPAGDEQPTSEDSSEPMTMPTTEYVKGIYAAAAKNGMNAPQVEAVKKQMILAPNGEVDIIATMQKALQVFQSPEFKKMLDDLAELVKNAESSETESHQDLISQGNRSVGGDATDRFIDQIRDKGFERANRGASSPGSRSPLSEKDELYKWLTIAGLK